MVPIEGYIVGGGWLLTGEITFAECPRWWRDLKIEWVGEVPCDG